MEGHRDRRGVHDLAEQCCIWTRVREAQRPYAWYQLEVARNQCSGETDILDLRKGWRDPAHQTWAKEDLQKGDAGEEHGGHWWEMPRPIHRGWNWHEQSTEAGHSLE